MIGICSLQNTWVLPQSSRALGGGSSMPYHVASMRWSVARWWWARWTKIHCLISNFMSETTYIKSLLTYWFSGSERIWYSLNANAVWAAGINSVAWALVRGGIVTPIASFLWLRDRCFMFHQQILTRSLILWIRESRNCFFGRGSHKFSSEKSRRILSIR